MFKCKKSAKMAAVVLCALAVVGCGVGSAGIPVHAAETGSPYNINIGIGSDESEVRFCWQSDKPLAGQLQIAKTSDVSNGAFPSNSTRQAAVEQMTATEGVLNNPQNTDHPVSSFQDESGSPLVNEYSDKVTVSGLAPNTSYTYRVGDGTNWSKNYTFQTSSGTDAFSFAAFGDPQMGASGDLGNDKIGWDKTLSKVYSKYPDVDFLFSMGDEVNDYGHLYAQQQEYKAFFNPTDSSNYLQTHILAAYSGNHDFQMGKYYSYHYNQPNLSTLGQTKTNGVDDENGDYWFQYGNTLFMVLEGNNFYDVSAHDAFMKQAVAANPDAVWKVVAFHQAPYSEANHDGATSSDDDTMFMRKNWVKLMDQYGVDIVLNGHDHYYTRSYQMYAGSAVDTKKTNSVTDPKGTVYFTLDSGSGSKYYKYNTTADHSFSAFGWQNNEPSYTYAKVDGNQFTLTTYAVSSDTPIDTYTITKTNQKSSGSTSNTTPVATVSNPQTGDSGNGSYLYAIIAAVALVLAAGCAAYLMKKEKRSN